MSFSDDDIPNFFDHCMPCLPSPQPSPTTDVHLEDLNLDGTNQQIGETTSADSDTASTATNISPTAADADAIIKETASAVASLVEPVNLKFTSDGQYSLLTQKGQRFVNDKLMKDNEYTTHKKFEEVLEASNKLVAQQYTELAAEDDEHNDGMKTSDDNQQKTPQFQPDFITKAPYRNLSTYTHCTYSYDNNSVSVNLNPTREVYLNSVRQELDTLAQLPHCSNNSTMSDNAKYIANIQKQLPVLENMLNLKCMSAESCVFQILYPHVKSAGAVALPISICNMLMEKHIAATDTLETLNEYLNVLVTALNQTLYSDNGRLRLHQYCFLCILMKQNKTYLEGNEYFCDEFRSLHTKDELDSLHHFIGIERFNGAYRKSTATNHFAPTINVTKDNIYSIDDALHIIKQQFSLVQITDSDGQRKWSVMTRLSTSKATDAPERQIAGVVYSASTVQTDNA